jgi:VIT1/CCC1 family predicted Fe2+/Mn2+ transporter
MPHGERHRIAHVGWPRAAVLGANDGLISTSSLAVGVAAAHSGRTAIFLAASAGLIAGALSMAAGEYVSVSSQADAEKADLELERSELTHFPTAERNELTRIYVKRGLDRQLAGAVADRLMAHDALDAHARDELGISERIRARPTQAALASAASFAAGAAMPVLLAALIPLAVMVPIVVASTLLLLLVLGATAARLGGAPLVRGSLRVVTWGAGAIALTALVGRLFGEVA